MYTGTQRLQRTFRMQPSATTASKARKKGANAQTSPDPGFKRVDDCNKQNEI